jgi:cell division protein FtsB
MVWAGLAAAVLVAVLALFVFPTRTYVDQRHQLTVASHQLQVLTQQNAALTQRVGQLHTDAEVERIAREQYHLVKPGEQAFAILPAPAPATTAPPAPPPPPAPPAHGGNQSPLSRLWQDLTGWL